MVADFNAFVSQSNERAVEIAKLLIKAAHMTHTMLIQSEKKSKRAREAMETQDKEAMWAVLQEYIQEYSSFITGTGIFTGIVIRRVDKAFYERVTVDDIRGQLQMSIGFVYAYEAFSSVGRETYKQCLKKLLKSSGLLSDAELKLLDA